MLEHRESHPADADDADAFFGSLGHGDPLVIAITLPCAELNATSTLSSRPSEARAGTHLSAHACVASWVPDRPAGVRDDNEKFQGGWSRWHERSRLSLQHRGEWFRRIGEVGDVDRHAALDQPARGGDVALRIDPD